tara:strand:- start:426 stop:1145 length:720 start_codon:yes stop_codon:yes gene_type:complete
MLNKLSIENNSFHYVSIILALAIYFSAFKNGKPTCDRFLINSFIYLLFLFTVYFSSLKIQTENDLYIGGGFVIGLISVCVMIGLFFLIDVVKNQPMKHLLLCFVIFILALTARKFYEKYDREYIEEIIKKCMIITVICGMMGIMFGKYLKPELEIILLFTFGVSIIFMIIDALFLESKYKDMLNYLFIFIFAGFIMFDTNRTILLSRLCKEGNANYIDNMTNMFLNIINLFNTLADLGD